MKRDATKQFSRKRIIATVSVVFAFIAISIIVIGFLMFRRYTINDHIRMGRGLAELVSDSIGAERVPEYLAQGREAPGYAELEARLYKLRQAVPDVKYLYVYPGPGGRLPRGVRSEYRGHGGVRAGQRGGF